MNDEDFCLIHGRDKMACDKGPIPYCRICDLSPEQIVEKLRDTAGRLYSLDSGSGDADVFERAASLIEIMDSDIGSLNNSAADAVSEAARMRSILVRIDHTLSVHGHMDANTPLHELIWGILGPSEPSDTKLSDDWGA